MTEEKPQKEYHRLKFSITDLGTLMKAEQNILISKELYDKADKPKISEMLQKGAQIMIDQFLEKIKTTKYMN